MSLLIMNSSISIAARKVLQFKSNVRFKQNGMVSKTYQRDSKVLYGKLVETLPEKRKREKRAKKYSIVTDNEEVSGDWKNEFLLRNTPKNAVRVVNRVSKICSVENEKLEKNNGKHTAEKISSNLTGHDETSNLQKSLSPHNEIKEKLIFETLPIDAAKSEVVDNSYKIYKNIIPSDIILQNMLSFSIYDNIKAGRLKHNTTPDVNEIFSFLQIDDRENLILPSVTRILSATMSEASKKALAIWKEKLVKQLGTEGFDLYQKDLFQDGHDLHMSIENFLLKKESEIPERVQPAFQSVEKVLRDISKVYALETHVVHPKLHYRGIVDCIAIYRDELCVIDWKKSDKRKDTMKSIYDAPTQVASYIGALNADLKYPFEVKKGLVVIAYTNGEDATIHELVQENLFIYWKSWLRRLQKYFVEMKKVK